MIHINKEVIGKRQFISNVFDVMKYPKMLFLKFYDAFSLHMCMSMFNWVTFCCVVYEYQQGAAICNQ